MSKRAKGTCRVPKRGVDARDPHGADKRHGHVEDWSEKGSWHATGAVIENS